MGLDDPLHVQLLREMSKWVQGDFGESLWQNVPALPLVIQRLPMTILLALATLIVALPFAIVLGVISALRPGSWIDRVVTTVSLAAVSIADFWLALMLILVVALGLGALPTSGSGGPEYLVLPALALAVRPMGRIAQITRSSLLEEMGKPYIVTARARGLSQRQVVTRHGLKNAALPMITLTGDETAALINGAVVIEVIFGWPGLGSLFIAAIEHRDLPLIEACVFVVATTVVLINLAVDVSYSFLDPRIQIR
jgi:peptide/nickel transport system permease protein